VIQDVSLDRGVAHRCARAGSRGVTLSRVGVIAAVGTLVAMMRLTAGIITELRRPVLCVEGLPADSTENADHHSLASDRLGPIMRTKHDRPLYRWALPLGAFVGTLGSFQSSDTFLAKSPISNNSWRNSSNERAALLLSRP
jgi:hypothetical protein